MQSATPFHTLHGIKETAESRKDAAIDGAQEICPLPLFGWGEESCKYDKSIMFEYPLPPHGHL